VAALGVMFFLIYYGVKKYDPAGLQRISKIPHYFLKQLLIMD
jgi:hypothetical protein